MSSDTIRNGTLDQVVTALQERREQVLDIVVPSSKVEAVGSTLLIQDVGEPEITFDGVTAQSGTFHPTPVAIDEMASALGVPLSYLRKLHSDRPDLFMANVNGWLHGGPDIDPDSRKFLLRCLTRSGQSGADGGVVRAWLSDKYRPIDDLDVMMSALQGIRESDVDLGGLEFSADLTDTRMYLRVVAPSIEVMATDLLRNYRAPDGTFGSVNPVINAGFLITNSEVGRGAFNLIPRLRERVCTNGLVISKDSIRRVHMGAKLDEGLVEWSKSTVEATLNLIKSQTKDAVKAFMSREYVEAKVAELTRAAGVPVAKPEETIERLRTPVGFTKGQTQDILAAFIDGADRTAGGVLQAVAAVAQHQSGDDAYDMEIKAVPAMEYAAGLR